MQMRMLSGRMTMHGANGALVKHPMRKPSTQGVMVYFSCDDCATQQALARENGGGIQAEIDQKPKLFINPLPVFYWSHGAWKTPKLRIQSHLNHADGTTPNVY